MYIPAKYLEENWEYQKEVITNHPLATVITFSQDGLIANHIPFVLAIDRETGKKYLHAHVAKKNHQIPALVSSEEVLVVFKSADSYITPTYYPTKQETHKVVPTWDFAAVHCYGKATIIDRKEWVRAQLDELTSQQEKERDVKWTVDEAPETHVNTLQKAICGLMIEITRIESKFKFEQKMPEQDVDGTIEGLAIDGKHEVSAFVKKCNHAS